MKTNKYLTYSIIQFIFKHNMQPTLQRITKVLFGLGLRENI